MTEREFAIEIVRTLQENGHQAFWAGGCVRDEILGRTPKDYDVATSALPTEVRRLFRRTVAVGISFGVVQVMGPKVDDRYLQIEVATFRSDGTYTDGRRPDSVQFSSAEEDAQRRDFTINGMFQDPLTGKVIDYVGGQEDLKNKLLRAIGDPLHRFTEDKLRMLRGARMATRFGFTIEPKTADAIRQMASQVEVVSAERIAEELRKLLLEPNRVMGVTFLRDSNLLPVILPEINALTSAQWDQALAVLQALGTCDFPVAFAGLLHPVGAEKAEATASRLRFSNDEAAQTVWLIEHQSALLTAPKMRLCRLKQLLHSPNIDNLLSLHYAIAKATGGDPSPLHFCEERLRSWTEEDLNPPPLVTGHDLMTELELKPGPLFKDLLEKVRDAQLDEDLRNRSEAIAMIRAEIEQRQRKVN